jgi:hypothetical protein
MLNGGYSPLMITLYRDGKYCSFWANVIDDFSHEYFRDFLFLSSFTLSRSEIFTDFVLGGSCQQRREYRGLVRCNPRVRVAVID